MYAVTDDIQRITNHTLVSTVGYLAGVEERIFESSQSALQVEVYQELEQSKDAKIIRNLSEVRLALEKNFHEINYAIRYGMQHLRDLPQFVPGDSLAELERNGISLEHYNWKTMRYIMEVNQLIASHINACAELFPDWLPWEYIKQLFIMPKGTTEEGVKAGGAQYYASMSSLPYQVYLNWPVSHLQGNILSDDLYFVEQLYKLHHERFTAYSRVSDVSVDTKNEIYRYLSSSRHAIIIIDCENADPYKVQGMLSSLDQEQLLTNVQKIMLYNDPHASTAWEYLDQLTEIPIEHYMGDRIKANKSLVDIRLTAGLVREYCENGMDLCILISSDSDYWGVISETPEVKYLVMLEQAKSSEATTLALQNNGIPHYWIDTFCTSDSRKLEVRAVMAGLRSRVTDCLSHLNLRDCFRQAFQDARMVLSEKEQNALYAQYLKKARISFREDGSPVLEFGC